MKLLAAAALIGLGLMSSAFAQNTQWCRGAGVSSGSTQVCQYNTYQQCMASRTGGESCYRNSQNR